MASRIDASTGWPGNEAGGHEKLAAMKNKIGYRRGGATTPRGGEAGRLRRNVARATAFETPAAARQDRQAGDRAEWA